LATVVVVVVVVPVVVVPVVVVVSQVLFPGAAEKGEDRLFAGVADEPG
jgi:hypothetical protein